MAIEARGVGVDLRTGAVPATPYSVAYILGASHSGSTLLSLLLNSHPDVATVGELAPSGIADPRTYRCSCGEFILHCPFWTYITRESLVRGADFSIERFGTRFCLPESRMGRFLLRPLHRGRTLELVRDAGLFCLPQWRHSYPRIVKANLTLIELVLNYYGARVFVDKGNVALRLKFLTKIPGLQVKALRVLRDGRAVSLTYMNPRDYADASSSSLRGGGSGGPGPERGLAMADAAHQWKRCNEEIEHALARLRPDNWLDVRYEELCVAPQRTLETISRFLDLDPTVRQDDFRSVEHHVVGNGMRLDTENRVRLDERWRAALSPSDLVEFERIAGSLNRRYGYE